MAPTANCRAIGNLVFLFNAESCLAFGHFIAVWAKKEIRFCVKYDAARDAFALSEAAFFLFDQNLAFSGVIGLSDNAFKFHSLH
jgi:hypothetical protein